MTTYVGKNESRIKEPKLFIKDQKLAHNVLSKGRHKSKIAMGKIAHVLSWRID